MSLNRLYARLFQTLVAFLLSATAIAATTANRAVIITTDCGTEIDDQWTIIHVARAREINLLGVVGNFAPNAGHGKDTAACARHALDIAGRRQVPAFAGADRALIDPITPVANAGTQFIIKTSRGFSRQHRLVIMGIGTGTDVASALLLDPTIADRITYVALAFNAYPAGGDGWNVTNDVAAYRVILDSSVPVIFASGQIANDTLTVERTKVAAVAGTSGTIAPYLATIFNKFLQDNGDKFPETEGGKHWPIWDEAVTAIVLGMTEGRKLPRPTINKDATFAFPNQKSSALFVWVTAIDRARLFNHLRQSIANY